MQALAVALDEGFLPHQADTVEIATPGSPQAEWFTGSPMVKNDRALRDVHTSIATEQEFSQKDWANGRIVSENFSNVDWSDIEASDGGCCIASTECKSVNLNQLKAIILHMKRRLFEERWMVTRFIEGEMKIQELSEVEQVNL